MKPVTTPRAGQKRTRLGCTNSNNSSSSRGGTSPLCVDHDDDNDSTSYKKYDARKSPFSESTLCTAAMSTSHGTTSHRDDEDDPLLLLATIITPTETAKTTPTADNEEESEEGSSELPSTLFDKLEDLELQWSINKRQSSTLSATGASAAPLDADSLLLDDSSSFLSLGSFSSSLRHLSSPLTPKAIKTPPFGRPSTSSRRIGGDSDEPIISIPSDVLGSIQKRRNTTSSTSRLRYSLRSSTSVSTRGGGGGEVSCCSSSSVSVFDRLYHDAKQRATGQRDNKLLNKSFDGSSFGDSAMDRSIGSSTLFTAGSRTRRKLSRSGNRGDDGDSVYERLYRGGDRNRQGGSRRRKSNIPSPSLPFSSLERRLSYQPPVHVTPRRPSHEQSTRALRDMGGSRKNRKDSVFDRLYRNEARPKEENNAERLNRKLAPMAHRRRHVTPHTQDESLLIDRCHRHAIRIQSSWRGHRGRREFLERRSVAIACQRFLRGFLERKRILKELDEQLHSQQTRGAPNLLLCSTVPSEQMLAVSAVRLQQWWRSHVSASRYSVCRTYAIIIQSHCRGFLVRHANRQLNSSAFCVTYVSQAVVTIQSSWRSSVIRTQYSSLKYCAVLIQRAYRGYLANKKQVHTLDQSNPGFLLNMGYQPRLEAGVTMIQSKFRSMATRQEYICLRYCSMVIQSNYRGYRRRRQELASCQIQRFWRMKSAASRFIEMRRCATAIQNLYRAHLMTLQGRPTDESSLEELAATKIQSRWRGSQLRIEYVWLRWQAIVIQSFFREKLQQNSCRRKSACEVSIRASYIRQQVAPSRETADAACRIQAWWRMNLAFAGLNYMRFSAVVIQSAFRRHCIRIREDIWRAQRISEKPTDDSLCEESGMSEKTRCTVYLQSWFRGTLHHLKFRAMLCAATKIQSHYRGQRARADLSAFQEASSLIGRTFRGFAVRRNVKAQMESIITLQAIWRVYFASKKQRRSIEDKKLLVATSLQRYHRGSRARSRYFLSLGASIVIQCQFRRYLASLRLNRLRNRVTHLRLNASMIVQAQVRHFLDRTAAAVREEAALTLQRIHRGGLVRRRASLIKMKTPILQRAIRGWSARKATLNRKLVTHAAICIQKVYRGFASRTNYMLCLGASLMIQCHIRRLSALKKSRGLRADRSRRSCAIRIQKWARKCIFEANRRKFYTALVLQKTFRGFLARNDLTTMVQSALKLQYTFRGFSVRRKLVAQTRSSTRLQAFLRGCSARSQSRQLVAAVICVQTHFRGYHTRSGYMLSCGAILMIQCCFRRRLALRELCRRKVDEADQRESSAIVLQRTYRGAAVRWGEDRKVNAAVSLQRFFRGLSLRRELVTYLKAAVDAQRVWRGYSARSSLREAVSGSICIQRHFRGSASRSRFMLCRGAAVMIQCKARGFIAANEFKRRQYQVELLRLSAAIKLQTWIRRWLVLGRYKRISDLVLLVQRRYRGMLVRRSSRKKLDSAILMQRSWRGTMARAAAVGLRDAIVSIQQQWRNYLSTKRAFDMWKRRVSAIRLQKFVRGARARSELRRYGESATLIQRRIRRRRMHLIFAASNIQAIARGFLARKIAQQRVEASKKLQNCYRMDRMDRLIVKMRSAASLLRRGLSGSLARSINLYALLQINSCSAEFVICSHCLETQDWSLQMEWDRDFQFVENDASTLIQCVYRGYKSRLMISASQTLGHTTHGSRSPLQSSRHAGLQSRTPITQTVTENQLFEVRPHSAQDAGQQTHTLAAPCSTDTVGGLVGPQPVRPKIRKPVALNVVEKLGPHRLKVELCHQTFLQQKEAARILQAFAMVILRKQKGKSMTAATQTSG